MQSLGLLEVLYTLFPDRFAPPKKKYLHSHTAIKAQIWFYSLSTTVCSQVLIQRAQ